MVFTTEYLREEKEKKKWNYIDWGTGWRHSLGPTWKWTRKVSGRDCVGGREVEKIWHAWRTEQGNCRPLGRAMRERGLWSGPEKVRTNTKGGAQRYMSNQREDRDEGRGGIWVTFQGCERMNDETAEWVEYTSAPSQTFCYILPCNISDHWPCEYPERPRFLVVPKPSCQTLPLLCRNVFIPPSLLHSFHIIH